MFIRDWTSRRRPANPARFRERDPHEIFGGTEFDPRALELLRSRSRRRGEELQNPVSRSGRLHPGGNYSGSRWNSRERRSPLESNGRSTVSNSRANLRATKSGNGSDARNNLPRGCNQPRTAGSGFDRNLSRMIKDLQSKDLQKLIQHKNSSFVNVSDSLSEFLR